MRPENIETVKKLCQRIVEEKDPESFSSLVLELNSLLSAEESDYESGGEKNQLH